MTKWAVYIQRFRSHGRRLGQIVEVVLTDDPQAFIREAGAQPHAAHIVAMMPLARLSITYPQHHHKDTTP